MAILPNFEWDSMSVLDCVVTRTCEYRKVWPHDSVRPLFSSEGQSGPDFALLSATPQVRFPVLQRPPFGDMRDAQLARQGYEIVERGTGSLRNGRPDFRS
jgi:hypothetical protein